MNLIINDPINIAVSSCLTGSNVRYNGGNKKNLLICNHFQRFFNLQEMCPEMAIGLGVPRQPVILIQDSKSLKLSLVDRRNPALNYSNCMSSFTKHFSETQHSTCAFIVKERSPSCGLLETPRYGNKGEILPHGSGFFTEILQRVHHWIPIISEHQLQDLGQQDNFLERVFILHLWHGCVKSSKSIDEFNTRIQHQIELRQSVLKFESNLVKKNKPHNIGAIMTIIKIPVTITMQVNFLKEVLQKYNIGSTQMSELIISYQHRQISLMLVIQQFQELFSINKLFINSNYFYPDKREIESREYYFEYK